MQRHQQQVRAVIRHLGTYASWLGHLLACRRWRPPPPPSRHGGHSREGGGRSLYSPLTADFWAWLA